MKKERFYKKNSLSLMIKELKATKLPYAGEKL